MRVNLVLQSCLGLSLDWPRRPLKCSDLLLGGCFMFYQATPRLLFFFPIFDFQEH